jgi:hypothetical protein
MKRGEGMMMKNLRMGQKKRDDAQVPGAAQQ